MTKDDAAERAYAKAVELVEKVRREAETAISFDHDDYRALNKIPDGLHAIEGLSSLDLNYTAVSDLVPLAGLKTLRTLRLNHTGVSDLAPLTGQRVLEVLLLSGTAVRELSPLAGLKSLTGLALSFSEVDDLEPLAGLKGLQALYVNQTRVSDLRQIAYLPLVGRNKSRGLLFGDTPAATRDPELARLAELQDDDARTRQTLAYLKTLPHWPDPLPWLAKPAHPPASAPLIAAHAQVAFLLRNALITRVTAVQFADQIEAALRGVAATQGNQLPPVLQTMAEVAEVLRALAPTQETLDEPLQEARLRLRIGQLEAIVEKLTQQLRDEVKLREAAEALAKKDGFGHSFRKSAGLATGAACIGLVSVGVPSAAVYFLGAEHPMVQAVLTVLGRVPKA